MATTPAEPAGEYLRIALYSDDRLVRQQVIQALGSKIASDLPELMISEYATHPALFTALDTDRFDLAILDGEATPLGGMGIARQIKDEYRRPVPVVVLVARIADAWLAAWSNAEAISPYPVDPIRLPETIAEVVRATRAHRQTSLEPDVPTPPGASSRHAGPDPVYMAH